MECVALVSDLIFSTKIRSTGQAVGVNVRVARKAAEVLASLESGAVKLVIVDLHASGESAIDVITEVKRLAPACPVLAFGSHVETDLLAGAAKAGAERVWPRSRFSDQLPAVLTELAQSAKQVTNRTAETRSDTP